MGRRASAIERQLPKKERGVSASQQSLQDRLDEIPDLVEHLYNDTQSLHFSRVKSSGVFIPPEFTNWRDEQRAWRETGILFDQSHHMPELFLEGPDALALLERVG